MIQRWCVIVACCFPGILCVQGAVWHVADCRHQCFLFTFIPHFLSPPVVPPLPPPLSFPSFPSPLLLCLLPLWQLSVWATCEYGITFQTATCTMQLTEISLFSALYCFAAEVQIKKREVCSEYDLFFSPLSLISRKASTRQGISMDQANNLPAWM